MAEGIFLDQSERIDTDMSKIVLILDQIGDKSLLSDLIIWDWIRLCYSIWAIETSNHEL